MKKLKDLPSGERPREKLLERGAGVLSDQELLAVILGKGNRNEDVLSPASLQRPVKSWECRCWIISSSPAGDIIHWRSITKYNPSPWDRA